MVLRGKNISRRIQRPRPKGSGFHNARHPRIQIQSSAIHRRVPDLRRPACGKTSQIIATRRPEHFQILPQRNLEALLLDDRGSRPWEWRLLSRREGQWEGASEKGAVKRGDLELATPRRRAPPQF